MALLLHQTKAPDTRSIALSSIDDMTTNEPDMAAAVTLATSSASKTKSHMQTLLYIIQYHRTREFEM